MMKHSLLALISISACLLLTSCQNGDGEGNASSQVSASLEDNRPTPAVIFQRMKGQNIRNVVSFRLLTAQSDVTSDVKATALPLVADYTAQGCEFNFTTADLLSEGKHAPSNGWDVGKSTFGYLNLPENKISGKSAGVYHYSLDDTNALLLGNKYSDSASLYDVIYTPDYLYQHAATLGPLFAATPQSEVNRLSDQATIVSVAKALSVYGILKERDSAITFAYVELRYSASSSSYTFNFYCDYQGKYAATGVYPLGARAVLSRIGATKIAAISDYLGE